MDSRLLTDNITKVRSRISAAVTAAERDPASVELIAVSKTKPASLIEQAYAEGLRHFGENYVAEALEKINLCQHLSICWHFIGPLQSNKTRSVAEHFDWIHSIDRLKLARRLNDQRPKSLPPLNICLQTNLDQEPTKSGITDDAELTDLMTAISEMPRLQLRGLMAIPPANNNSSSQRHAFAKVRELSLQHCAPLGANELSMGMSGDLEAAIAEGATMVRIGTDIFGTRYTARPK
jgi:pyridoxal phosphate enzyme (YggS family)|tara:strand:+ start:1024 stop:1728 length:705 start_codon:yes stop_codon:yes gene_type:complete